MARDAVIRIRTTGERGLQQALQGVVRLSARATAAQRRDAETTSRAVERERERSTRNHTRSVRQELDETRRAERAKRRLVDEGARHEETVLRRLASARRGSRGSGGSFGARLGDAARQAGAGAIAVGRSALGRVEGYQSAIGVPSRDEQVRSFINAQQNLIRTTSQAGVSTEERNHAMAEVGRVAASTNTDPTQIIEALAMAQERFSNLPVDNLEAFARAAQASGSNVGDWVAAAGEFNRQLGVSEDEMSDLVGAIYQAGRAGSMNPGDFASSFSGTMSSWRQFRGEGATGVTGAREMIALTQSLGAGGRDPGETRTLLENFMGSMNRPQTQRAMERRLGRDVFDSEGRLAISSADLLQRMHDDGSFDSPAGLRRMGIDDRQAQQAIGILMGRFDATGGNEVADLMNVSSEEGKASIDETVAALMSSTSGRAQAVGIEAQVNFLQNGEQLVALMTQLAGPLSDFQSRMPVASEALSFLGETARDVGVTFAALRLLRGGAGAGGAGAAGAGAAGAGGGGLAAWILGPMAAGAAGFFGTIAASDALGLFNSGEDGAGKSLGEQWLNMGQMFDTAFSGGETRGPTGPKTGQAAPDSKAAAREHADALRNGGPIPVQIVGGAGSLGTTIDESRQGPGGPARR